MFTGSELNLTELLFISINDRPEYINLHSNNYSLMLKGVTDSRDRENLFAKIWTYVFVQYYDISVFSSKYEEKTEVNRTLW